MEEQEFLETIVKAVVSEPDKVKVSRSVDEQGVLLRFWVSKPDMGIVIGSAGVNMDAIRRLVKLVGFQQKEVVNLRLEEPIIK